MDAVCGSVGGEAGGKGRKRKPGPLVQKGPPIFTKTARGWGEEPKRGA